MTTIKHQISTSHDSKFPQSTKVATQLGQRVQIQKHIKSSSTGLFEYLECLAPGKVKARYNVEILSPTTPRSKRKYTKRGIKAINKREYLRKWRAINKDRSKKYRQRYLRQKIQRAISTGTCVNISGTCEERDHKFE